MIEVFTMADIPKIDSEIKHSLKFKNPIHLEQWRDGVLIAEFDCFNDVVDEGANLILNTFFNSATQITTWYLGLISLTSFTALANSDVMNSHAGWTEFTTYNESVRQTWGSATTSTRSVTNATAATFTIGTGGTVKGLFVTSNNTKGGTTGKLWATALFNADVPVNAADVLKATYTISD